MSPLSSACLIWSGSYSLAVRSQRSPKLLLGLGQRLTERNDAITLAAEAEVKEDASSIRAVMRTDDLIFFYLLQNLSPDSEAKKTSCKLSQLPDTHCLEWATELECAQIGVKDELVEWEKDGIEVDGDKEWKKSLMLGETVKEWEANGWKERIKYGKTGGWEWLKNEGRWGGWIEREWRMVRWMNVERGTEGEGVSSTGCADV